MAFGVWGSGLRFQGSNSIVRSTCFVMESGLGLKIRVQGSSVFFWRFRETGDEAESSYNRALMEHLLGEQLLEQRAMGKVKGFRALMASL